MTRYHAFSIAFFILLADVPSALAESDRLEPRLMENEHHSEFGNFTHSSSVFEETKNRIIIEYAVCNHDESVPLNYTWNGPNMTVGEGGRLPVRKCDILQTDAPDIEHDRRAVIFFTQASRRHRAPAHVSKLSLPIASEYIPTFLRSYLRKYFLPEGTAALATRADLAIIQVQSNGSVRHIISWHPPRVIVAISTKAFGEPNATAVVGAINEAGYKAETLELRAVLAESDIGTFKDDRLSDKIIVITKIENSPEQLEFNLESKTAALARSKVTVIDRQTKRVIVDFEITSFSP